MNTTMTSADLDRLFGGLHLMMSKERVDLILRQWARCTEAERKLFALHVRTHGTNLRPKLAFNLDGPKERASTCVQVGKGIDSKGRFDPVPNKQYTLWLTWNAEDFELAKLAKTRYAAGFSRTY